MPTKAVVENLRKQVLNIHLLFFARIEIHLYVLAIDKDEEKMFSKIYTFLTSSSPEQFVKKFSPSAYSEKTAYEVAFLRIIIHHFFINNFENKQLGDFLQKVTQLLKNFSGVT